MDKWIRSSACKADSPMCAEVMRHMSGLVTIRNSTNPEATVAFTADEFAVFVEGVRRGDFDLP